jgi:pimeloyl-ACP methyl ester carboxylesterase
MWLAYLLGTVLLLYLGAVATVTLMQAKLLFPTTLVGGSAATLPSSAKRVEIRTPDDVVLAGVRIDPRDRQPGDAPLLIGFGGNAWNAEVMALYLHDLFPEAAVVAFHYRGYPPSTGRPSAGNLLADALTIFDHLEPQLQQPAVAVGFSIGSGPAAYLARHRPVRGMILVTPFDSLKALAQSHFRWAPVGLLFRHEMAVLEFVRGQRTPTAMIAAGRDAIVPTDRTEPLRRSVPRLVYDRVVADAGHNDLYDHPAFRAAMREALEKVAFPAGEP